MNDLIENFEVFNGNKKDFLEKRENIWLGVSISLKPYSEKLASQYLKLIAKYSKAKALVFVADEIAAINYKVLEKYGEQTALKKAISLGDSFCKKYGVLIRNLPLSDRKKIILVRWNDMWNEEMEIKYKLIKKEYLTNSEFKKDVEKPIITYLKNSRRTVKKSRVEKMSEYILKELPSLLDGVEYGGVKYKLMIYPTYGKTSLSELVTKIQKGIMYPKLRKNLGLNGDHILIDSPIKEK